MISLSDECVAATVSCDATRANMRAAGELNSVTATVLGAAANEHILARRRYVRLDLSKVTSVDDRAIVVLAEIHSRLLAERGTFILTGVESWLEIALAGADDAFLVIAPTAADDG